MDRPPIRPTAGAAGPPGARLTLAALSPASPVRVEAPKPHDAPGTIRTARMLLRPMTPADREAYLDGVRLSRAALDRFAPLHKPAESDGSLFERQLSWSISGYQTDSAQRMIGVAPDGRIAGGFNLNAISRGLEFKADITWWVSTPFEGQGYATEGVAALTGFALADLPAGLGLIQVSAWIRRDNGASVRIAEKLGFLRAGEERSYLRTGEEWTLHDLFIKRA